MKVYRIECKTHGKGPLGWFEHDDRYACAEACGAINNLRKFYEVPVPRHDFGYETYQLMTGWLYSFPSLDCLREFVTTEVRAYLHKHEYQLVCYDAFKWFEGKSRKQVAFDRKQARMKWTKDLMSV